MLSRLCLPPGTQVPLKPETLALALPRVCAPRAATASSLVNPNSLEKKARTSAEPKRPLGRLWLVLV